MQNELLGLRDQDLGSKEGNLIWVISGLFLVVRQCFLRVPSSQIGGGLLFPSFLAFSRSHKLTDFQSSPLGSFHPIQTEGEEIP